MLRTTSWTGNRRVARDLPVRHLARMSSNSQPGGLAFATAEEVLRVIYGDDLKGCTVSLDSIAGIIDQSMKQSTARQGEWLELYDKVVEAVHLLSTPPDKSKVTEPGELQTLLTHRLDGIHMVTTKTIETLESVRGKKSEDEPGS